MNDVIHILRKGTCPSLSSRSNLTYEFGYNDQTKTILFHISNSTGAGHFSDAWIPLDAILNCLQGAKEPFSLNVFKSLHPGQSNNNIGFVGAVLQKEGLIVSEKRQYLRKDTKPFMAELSKLIKPTKHSAKKCTPQKMSVQSVSTNIKTAKEPT